MGYDTWFNINTSAAPQDFREEEAVRKEISKAVYGDEHHHRDIIENGFEAHWYDYDKDLIKISKKHPTVLIEVSGDGENSDDLWAARYRNGESETVRFEGLPDFKEILTPQEEEKIFSNAREAYCKAIDGLKEAAVRRIRMLKDRITVEPERHLSIELLNNNGPELVISGELPLSNREYVPLMVGGIHDDGETLWTEEDPVCIPDMLPDDVTDVVNLLEGYVKDIEKGVIKGRWNEEEEWYELYYAGSDADSDTDK